MGVVGCWLGRLVRLVSRLVGLVRLIGRIRLVGLVWLVGRVRWVGLVRLVRRIGLVLLVVSYIDMEIAEETNLVAEI